MKRIYLATLISITVLLAIPNINVESVSIKNKNSNSEVIGNIIYVDDNNTGGPWDGTLEHPYKTISDAIYNSTTGDTIYVFDGIYKENLNVDKSINLEGEDKNNTIVDGDYQNYVIHFTAGNVNIKNFTIRNSGGYRENAGLKIDSNNNVVTECNIYRTRAGIYINKVENNEINNCTFYSNEEGILLNSSDSCKIEHCCFYHNSFGLNIEESEKLEIYDCYVNTCGFGFFINSSSDINISNSAIYNNNDNGGGFIVSYCKNITIFNCNINHNGQGLNIFDSTQIFVIRCDLIWNTHVAVGVGKDTSKIYIENCEITGSFRFGITVANGSCTLKYNNMYANLFGIRVDGALCDARENWWGSFFGPAIFQRKIKDRLFFKHGFIRFFPWLPEKNQNAGSSWNIDYNRCKGEINPSRFEQIKLPGKDTDGDGCPDWWEEKWGYDPNKWDDHANLDPDGDGLNNIEECFTDQWGSSPFHKDIFIEFDWLESSASNISSNKPAREDIEKMIQVFSEHDITLHMDDGSLGGGEMITNVSSFSMSDLIDMYWDYFLHNDLNNPRKSIFHWCLVSDYGPEPGLPGFAVVGWDGLDSFEISAQKIKDAHSSITKSYVIISVTMHELGHNLGLLADDHGGIDSKIATMPFTIEFFKYSRYKSCLNYMYTYHILDYSDGSRGRNDFDDWGNIDLTFFKNTHFEWPK